MIHCLCIWLQCLAFYLECYCFQTTAEHIPGILNTAADVILRNNISLFQSPVSQIHPITLPQTIVDLIVINRPDWGSQRWTHWFTSSLIKDSPLPKSRMVSAPALLPPAQHRSPIPTEHSQTAFAADLSQPVSAGTVIMPLDSIKYELACLTLAILFLPKLSYRIAGNFCIFRILHPLYENKNCKNLNVQKNFPFARDL